MATLQGAKFKENHPDLRRSFVANHDNFQESAPLMNDDSNFSRLDSTGSIQNIQPWNVFMESVHDEGDDTDTSKVIEIATKVFKAVVYIITFCMVLGGAVVSKGAMLFMTSIIRRNRNFEICKTDDLGLEKDKNYLVEMSDPERYAWIWCLLFALFIPEILSFLRSCRICIFKSCKRSKLKSFLMVFVMESLHVSGLVTLVFLVLPELDSIEAAMLTNAVCLVPGILNLLSRNTEENHFVVKLLIDIVAICSQGSVFILWHLHSSNGLWKSVLIPFSVIFVSFGWWENFVDKKASSLSWFVDIKNDLRRSRYFVYSIVSVWKLLLIFSLALLCLFGKGENVKDLFTYFSESFTAHPVTVYWQNIQQTDIPERVKPDSIKTLLNITSDSLVPILVAVTHAVASLLCYIVGKFACKVCIQGFSYALPVSLTIPVALSFLISGCREHVGDPCLFSWFSPYLFWQCPKEDFLSYFSQHYGVWILWIVSQTWIAIHIWTPKCERLASTEKLFVNPMYSSILIDQSLALNRRKEEEENIKVEDLRLDAHRQSTEMQHFYVTPQGETAQHDNQEIISDNTVIPRNITRIYACATMWHETPEEMVQLLKSVMRMDEDQSARRNAQIYLDVMDPDFYLFEAHIFFDDAFVVSDEDDDEFVVNNFVKDFVAVINEAASKVHQTLIRLKPPTKIPTPYGGRLVWSLPGGNLLTVHLKNKELIRHKKRWSQVMYMYYLLGHRLMELDIETNEKAVLAENTYVLALDGDINFQPHAVQLLVDLMKKNKRLGAACGRIHPVGTGAMVYYQKFEYAIGHWLQKATEHMIGCVLCSPGCFSLFRAKALMDDNVMRTYTAKSREAAHYIQYDQGEDRWLCTLLLQRGYRVEYSAASDAYTHCPETFGEFYTQRRRWAPSTMANIMDLLVNYKRTVGCNDNISMPYIAYQVLMMAGTILGPGTIFLMLVGAMVSAFSISSWNSLMANLFPVAFFIIICFLAKNDTQILIAQIFSAAYALLMMAVLVGIALQLVQDGISSPSAIFLLSLTASFLVAALVHPQEFWCVVHGLLYFLSVPSMYLLLFLYSIVNLNVVSWGTREVQTKKTKKQLAEEELHRKEEVVKQKKNTGMFSWLSGLGDRDGAEEEEGSITFGLANLFRCMCCTYPKPNEEKMQLMKIHEQLQRLTDTINDLQKQTDKSSRKMSAFRRRSSIGRSLKNQDTMDTLAEENEEDEVAEYDSEVEDEYSEDVDQGHTYNQPDSSPYWITDENLKNGNIEYLTEKEIVFWKEMIAAYLYPLVDNPDEKAKIAAQLKELRNKAVFVLLMANSLFILIVFLLQANKEDLHIDWPLNVKANITFIPATNEVVIEANPLQLEPINLVLAFFFTLILIIQFVGMLLHRLETMSHILASTEIKICSKNMEDMSGEAFINKHAVKLAKILQQLRDDERTEKQVTNDKVDRRPTIQVLEKRRNAKSKMKTLDFAFRKRYDSISADSVDKDVPVLRELRKLSMTRDTLAALQKRRDTVVSRASIRNSIYLDTPRMTRSDILEMRRLNEQFSTPNGSVRSGIRNSAYETDSDEEAGIGRLRATLHGEMNLPSGSELPKIRFKDEDTASAVSRGSLRRKLSSINEN